MYLVHVNASVMRMSQNEAEREQQQLDLSMMNLKSEPKKVVQNGKNILKWNTEIGAPKFIKSEKLMKTTDIKYYQAYLLFRSS